MLPDHLGSVRQVVAPNGNVIQSTSYTPFGEVMTSEGEQSAFGFTGEQMDQTGLLFLRARYYVPGRGTFLSRDAWEGDALRPQTFNPYGYVGGNPINLADPSGNCYGPLEWLRSLPIEARNCIALDQSLYILGNGNYSDSDKRWAGAYVGTWTVGHSYFLVGAGILGGKAVAASAGPIGNVVRWGQSYLLRHPNASNALGIGMIAASTVDDISAVTLALSGDREAAGQIVTIANSDPFAFNDFLAPVAVLAQRGSKTANSCATAADELITVYHATNNRGAESIIDHGIKLSKGRPKLDFNPSGQGGFYVTNDLNQAEIWAKRLAKRSNGEPIVLKFSIPQNQLDQLDGLMFHEADDQWGQFVVAGRHGTLKHTYDYVEGPMLRNVRSARRGDTPQPLGHQLAIFTEPAVSIFERYLVDMITP